MSLDAFDLPNLNAVRTENLTLYLGLLDYMEHIPGGPWCYATGYDPTPDGQWYTFVLRNLYHPEQSVSVRAEKNGGFFSFSSNASPEH